MRSILRASRVVLAFLCEVCYALGEAWYYLIHMLLTSVNCLNLLFPQLLLILEVP